MLKAVVLRTLEQPTIARLLARVMCERRAVFMLHRFASSHGNPEGHAPRELWALLAYLRRTAVDVVSVDELVAQAAGESAPKSRTRPAVAFTVDDGYADFAEAGQPVFAEFDAPVTLYVVPGIVDTDNWFWWDRVAWAFEHTRANSCVYEHGTTSFTLRWDSVPERKVAMATLLTRLKQSNDSDRRAVLHALPAMLDVDVPSRSPDRYRVLNWSELQTLAACGVSIGAHTMTHPILARCTDDVARYEVLESSRRIVGTFASASRIFCYPNGRNGDFGSREFALLEEAGMRGAVSAEPGLVAPATIRTASAGRWSVPRFNYEASAGMTARLLFL